MYECEDCGYVTNKKFNFMKHKNRKTVCKRSIKIETGTEQNLNTNPQIYNENSQIDNAATQIYNENSQICYDTTHLNNDSINNPSKCPKCNKQLYNMFSLKRHLEICKGVDNLTCDICFKKFSSVSSKNNHKRNVKCSPPLNFLIQPSNVEQRNLTNISYGAFTNGNNNNTNVQNITINSFGNENLTHLIHDKDIIHKTNTFSKKGLYGLVDILDHIYLDPEHPENNTIIKLNERGDDVLVMNETNTWEYRDYEDVKDQFIEALNNFLRIYNKKKNELNIKLVEQKERLRIKEFIIFLMTVGGIIENDLAEELNVDDDYVVNEEKINSKFDKATLSKLFFKSNLLFNKTDKKIKRI